jgi:ParB family chromosome partitioning protein
MPPTLTANSRTQTQDAELLRIDPRAIKHDPDNVRREEADIEPLAASLREHGLLQPIGVARDNGSYRVVYGSRRRAAAVMAGLPEIPCVLVQAAPEDRLVRQLVENLQRADLNPIDQAEGLSRLRRDIARRSPDLGERELDEASGKVVGLSGSTVRRYLGLRSLAPGVRDLIADGQLTVTQAQHLHAIQDTDRQEALARLAAERGLSAANVARACKAAANRPNLAVEEAVDLGESNAQLPEAPREKVQTERVARAPKAETEDSDADLWDDRPADDDDDAPPIAGMAESADGHRVFRIRSVAVFCDEVDRLARALVDGDLDRAADDDPAAPLKLRLAARQLEHTSKLLGQLLGKKGWR